MLYGCIERGYAEDNDISNSKAFAELHCQDDLNEVEPNEDGELEFSSITEYVE